MRSFVLDGPFSLNGYAEVPENASTDYMDEVYEDLDVWGGLTFWVVTLVFVDNASIYSWGAVISLAVYTALISNHYDGKHDE